VTGVTAASDDVGNSVGNKRVKEKGIPVLKGGDGIA
jgi:hypothetical protein